MREMELMCVWDGTYTAPEAEREAMDQIPGWNDDAVTHIARSCRAGSAPLIGGARLFKREEPLGP